MTNPTELYACLYVKEFPAQAILRLRPEMHSRPCVVMEGRPPSQTVCSLNAKARLLHLSHGMTRVEVDTFPGPVVLSRSRETEMATKAVLLECAGCYSPRVQDCSDDRSFLCALNIAGTTGLFGPPETLARNLLTRVDSLGMTACVAVSGNFHAAVAVAKGPLPLSVRVIPTGEESTALAALPLTVLYRTETQAETFALWGIHTLGMLAALPEKELIARIGQEGKPLRQMARGERPHLFQPAEPAFTLAEKIEFDSPVELLESLLFAVGVMLDQLILRAKARILALASELLHGEQRQVWVDGADQGQSKAIRAAAPQAQDVTCRRTRYNDRLDEIQRAKNRSKSRVRAKAEHPFRILKRVFGFEKVRSRGQATNRNRLCACFALGNLYLHRKRLVPAGAQFA